MDRTLIFVICKYDSPHESFISYGFQDEAERKTITGTLVLGILGLGQDKNIYRLTVESSSL